MIKGIACEPFGFCFSQVNGTEIEYEFEEITLERVSISDATENVEIMPWAHIKLIASIQLHACERISPRRDS